MIRNLDHIKTVSGQITKLLNFLDIDVCKNGDRAIFFDVDGTLSRDDCLELLISTIIQEGLIPQEEQNRSYKCAREAWKNHDISFHDYLDLVIKATASLKQLSEEELNNIVKSLVKNKGYYYLFTWLMLIRLKTMGYKLIAVSGAPDFMLREFLKNAGIFTDSIDSSRYIFKDGKFTGEIDLSVIKDKGAYITNKFGKDLDFSKCIALGDTVNDLKLFEPVGKVVTVNPTFELAEVAKKKKWPIVVERKNLILVFPKAEIEID
ncbi:HAD family hydrolase [Patescibacteria group bacterium]